MSVAPAVFLLQPTGKITWSGDRDGVAVAYFRP